MRRRPVVPSRKALFIGVEGRSDEAFIAFLQRCCDRDGLHVHLKASAAGGGSPRSVVEDAGRALVRSSPRRYAAALVLLDADRIDQDPWEGREASAVAKRYGLRLLYSRPNLEGLLVRLHAGHERSRVTARHAMRELRRLWPDYRKPPSADELIQRFMPENLDRAARYDEQLRVLLQVVGLVPD